MKLVSIGKKSIPVEPGEYYWSEWACMVRVYRKGRGAHLYVCAPGGLEVRVSPRIAGTFTITKR